MVTTVISCGIKNSKRFRVFLATYSFYYLVIILKESPSVLETIHLSVCEFLKFFMGDLTMVLVYLFVKNSGRFLKYIS